MTERSIREAADDADAQHVRARVAWYYYVGGLTQQEIAERLKEPLGTNQFIGFGLIAAGAFFVFHGKGA